MPKSVIGRCVGLNFASFVRLDVNWWEIKSCVNSNLYMRLFSNLHPGAVGDALPSHHHKMRNIGVFIFFEYCQCFFNRSWM